MNFIPIQQRTPILSVIVLHHLHVKIFRALNPLIDQINQVMMSNLIHYDAVSPSRRRVSENRRTDYQ